MKKTTNTNVSVRVERQNIPTYPALAPDPNPMFFETRNIQGSNGTIYPHPFTDQLSSEKVDREYEVITLENEYVEVSLLPEIGGRIFSGRDKTNGYDFFYRHKVIKPALIGLFGPWISGGVEFNWPQHHRPGTYDPASWALEHGEDGSITVWMGEHDALNRTKGMVGICLYPGKALVETKVRLFNRTAVPQSFLWWENAGVHIHDRYQVIFPPDVHYSVYHTKNPVFPYPIIKGKAFGHDYGEGTDISWWVNNPGAVSYFSGDTKYEFFGGYDHIADAGVIHYADSAISPGKKYFAWGNGDFGHAWQKNLMDDTGEYLELMAGVYTDNQPDFTWMMPGETRTFSQFWYPVQKTGAVHNANLRAAVSLTLAAGNARGAVYANEALNNARVILHDRDQIVFDRKVSLGPGKPFSFNQSVRGDALNEELSLLACDASGLTVISYQPDAALEKPLPPAFEASRAPEQIASVEELYLEGLHLEQYRHPTLLPQHYWQEALRRDPQDSRSRIALGKLAYRRADFDQAEAHFRNAVSRLTSRNQNPWEGEAHYFLGLTLIELDKPAEARKALNKAAWTYAWKSSAYYTLALLDCREGNYPAALIHLNQALDTNASHLNARALKAAVLRILGRLDEAAALATSTTSLDRLAIWAAQEARLSLERKGDAEGGEAARLLLDAALRDDVQNGLDLAFDYISAGLWDEAGLALDPFTAGDEMYPIAAYTKAWLAQQRQDSAEMKEWLDKGASAAVDYCFPWRLGEKRVLEFVLTQRPDDAHAAYYLGNLMYDKRHYQQGITLWRKAVSLDPALSIAWRNLGLANYNLMKDIPEALELYRRSLEANPGDARTLLEQDALLRRRAAAPEERLLALEKHLDVVARNDNLTIQRVALLNRLGRSAEALAIMQNRSFHAWEGGEGSVTAQYASAQLALGREALRAGDAEKALDHFLDGAQYHANLGENVGPISLISLGFYQGLAEKALGRLSDAHATLARVREMGQGKGVDGIFGALAQREMGQPEESRKQLLDILASAKAAAKKSPEPNFFHSGHPSPLFEEDPYLFRRSQILLVQGLAQRALGAKALARRTLRAVLAEDPSNTLAATELKEMG